MSYIGNSPGVASQRVTTTLTATAAQTQFTTQSGYVLGYVDVYLNGAKLVNGSDFEAITGTYITLFAGAAAGDVVELISYVPRGLSDGYTKAEADAKFLDVGGDTASGNLALATASLSGNLTLSGGTANGVGYLNGSKVVTTGSALTFDGTILATPTLNLTNALGVAYGGTGQTTANASLNALLPAQTGNATKYLQTDGTSTSWDAISISTADITGTLPTANGGTNLTSFTANGLVYASSSSALATGSALTYNGTSLGVGSSSYGDAGTISLSIGVAGTTAGGLQLWASPAQEHYIQWGDSTVGSATYAGAISYSHSGDFMRFWTSSAERLRLTSTSLYTATNINVGIGNSNPQTKLHITTDGTYDCLLLQSTASGNARSWNVGPNVGTNAVFAIRDSTAGENRLNIDLSGNVLVGTLTNTNSSKLVIGGTISQTVGGNQYLVVDQSDVGTAPNQIPLNQYLGSMAFQERENINFTGGTGALSSLDIAAISAQLNVSATDVFVYDTSKDSDGGAWRKRTQHTSWYNETLNTATRGARREFPAVAVIVATQNTVAIYDGDAPDLPMWMVFVVGSAGITSTSMIQIPGYNRSIYMLNAVLVEGTQNEGGNYGNPIINFISEKVVRMDSQAAGGEGGTWLGNIADRNITKGYAISSEDYAILGSQINDIAMTVLPNAPIDPATGLPVPTIAVATSNGVSVIKDNGTVSNLAWSGAALRLSGFNSDNAFCAIYNNGNTIYNVKYKPPYNTQDTSENYYYNLAVAQGPSLPWNPGNEKSSWGRKNEYVIGTTGVLRYLGEGNDGVPATRIYNVQTSTYNSGYMVGDIKGAWLSDTAQETVVGTELITNGTFDSSTTGWSTYPGYTGTVLSIDTNRLKVFGGGAQQSFSTVIGKKYVLSYTLTAFNPGGVYLGTESSGTGGFSYLSTGSQSTTGTYIYTFTATSTTAYIGLFAWNAASEYAFYDNVSVRLADIDRSPNYKGLQVFGTITKTPVAAGADLVGYEGFGTANYLMRPTDSDFTGLNTRFFASWVKCSDASNYQYLMSIGNRSGATWGVSLEISTGFLYVYDTPNSSLFSTTNSLTDNQWHFVCVLDTGRSKEMYVDGKLIKSVATTAYTLPSNCNYYVGVFSGSVNIEYPFLGSLALQRFSVTLPSPDQVAKMYNDEKFLFQPNAKATLYGTSDSVTALAYDNDTQLLHIGTSSGRSVFDGLRRVDSTTTAVATAISAVDGLIVEN